MTKNATDGGGGGMRKEGNKMIKKEAKTGEEGGVRIIYNDINRF